MNTSLVASLFLASSLTAVHGQADEENLPLVKPQVKTLAVFKNGLGFVIKSGETRLQEGWARMDQLPAASLGTFWIGTASKTGPVTELIAYKEKASEEADALTLSELLAANVGKEMVMTYHLGGSPIRVEGTLLAVPPDRKPEEMPPSTSGWRPPVESGRGEIVLFRSQNQGRPAILSLNKSTIQSIELREDSNLKTKVEKEVAKARFHVGGNPPSAEITMAYLEKGMVWSPSYRVDIRDDKQARIALEAVLANDVEDLQNVDVTFVVGYPNFLYADVVTPLSLQQTVAAFIQSLISGGQSDLANRYGNVMSQSVIYNVASFGGGGIGGGAGGATAPEAAYSVAQPMPGETSEDLYFYRKTGVTMKKGDRARYEVFSESVPYTHLYQWEVPETSDLDDRGFHQGSQRGPNAKEPEYQVWHVLRLENTSQHPWTTAPAFTMKGVMPTAQDVLKYTPPGGKNTLKLTVATDLRAEQSQIETARKSVSLHGSPFDVITLSCKLKVTNWKAQNAPMMVRKSILGEVIEAPEGKVTKVARKLTAVNPVSEVEWEFALPGGKEKELACQYQVYVRR